MPDRRIIMLEDEAERLARFVAMLSEHLPDIPFQHWASAHKFIAAYGQLLKPPDFIALDHDLFVASPNDPDPGDGRHVAAFLATQHPCCPVLIHSSNTFAAESMLYSLRDAGWTVERIAPLGDDWIEAYWLPTMLQMLEDTR